MKLKKLVLPFFFFLALSINAQNEEIEKSRRFSANPENGNEEKNRPAIGFKYGFIAGKYSFPSASIYSTNSLDPFQMTSFGAFAQLFISKRFHIQPEFSMYERKYFSKGTFVYRAPPPLDQDVFYKINGTQRILEIGLMGYYNPIDYKFLHPYVCIGYTIGKHRDIEIYQYELGFGEQRVSHLLSREGDGNAIIGIGTDLRFGKHFKFFVEGRYMHGQTSVKTQEWKKEIVFPTNMYIKSWVGNAGVAWKF
jgi:Outer membrane protein beta-barrel domain